MTPSDIERLRAELPRFLANLKDDASILALGDGTAVLTKGQLLSLLDRVRELEGSRAAQDVIAERYRQVTVESWTPTHDDEHSVGELAEAAVNYAAAAVVTTRLGGKAYDTSPPFGNCAGISWPWAREWWKPGTPRQMLVKAGALILAEIERLDRASLSEGEG